MSDANSIQADVSGVKANGDPDAWRNARSRHERGPRDILDDPGRGPWNSQHNGKFYEGHFDAFEQIVPVNEQTAWIRTFSDDITRDLGFVLMELMEDLIERRKAAGKPTTAFPAQ